MEPVLRMVADNTRLKHLDLAWNLIDARAAEALARALEINTTLKRVNLASNAVGRAAR